MVSKRVTQHLKAMIDRRKKNAERSQFSIAYVLVNLSRSSIRPPTKRDNFREHEFYQTRVLSILVSCKSLSQFGSTFMGCYGAKKIKSTREKVQLVFYRSRGKSLGIDEFHTYPANAD